MVDVRAGELLSEAELRDHTQRARWMGEQAPFGSDYVL